MTGMAALLVATLFISFLHTSTPFHAPPLLLTPPAPSLAHRAHAGRFLISTPIPPAGAAQIRGWRATGWLDRAVRGSAALDMSASDTSSESGVALEEDPTYLLSDDDEAEEEADEADLTGDGGGKVQDARRTPAPLPAGPVPVREFRAVAGASGEGRTKLRLVSYNVLGPKQVRLWVGVSVHICCL